MQNQAKALLLIAATIVPLVSATVSSQEPDASGLSLFDFGSLETASSMDTPWNQLLEGVIDEAIDPNDYVCNAPTFFHLWVQDQVNQIDLQSLITLSFLGETAWAPNYKILFDSEASDEYVGANGEFTREQVVRHADNQRFWDVPTDDILLQAMHGIDLADDAKMLPLIDFIIGGLLPSSYIVDTVQTAIEGGTANLLPLGAFGFPLFLYGPDPSQYEFPGIPGGYYHPIFTLNAFAFRGGEIPGIGVIPPKIVMGDGILEAIVATGLGQNAPDYIHAHEFAHHVQFRIGAFEPPPPAPEKTRRTELMADAFGAYYSSHARGATFQAMRFADVMTAAFGIGDCAFVSNGHHGTPDQREAAAAWGGDITASQREKGHILSAAEMLSLFDAALPDLVAPDAP